MELSHYIKIYPYKEKPGYFLLFSTKKGSLTLISKKTYNAIEKGTLSAQDEALLSKLGMIVDNREDEKKEVTSLIDHLNAINRELNITVVTNLDCNFACTYCYEGDMKGKLYMSDETTGYLIKFIEKNFSDKKKSLYINFYGGEPLLSTKLIKKVSHIVKPFVESKGAMYSFSLTTNGSLFKKDIAEELADIGLKEVKITLDGPAEIHDRKRPFKSGAGSFDTILKNIRETCDIVKISLGGNFEKDDYEKFPLLLDCLLNEGLTPDKVSVIKFDPVLHCHENFPSVTDFNDSGMSINEPWLSAAYNFLREAILQKGYYTPKPIPSPCIINIKDSYVVNFDGVIYKCPAFIGNEDFAVGNVQSGINDYSTSYKLNDWKENDDCMECEYLPLCFGGCKYMTFVRDGNINNLDCKRNYFETSLEKLLIQDIKYSQKADKS